MTDNIADRVDEILLDFVRPKGQIIPYEEGQKESAEMAGQLLNYWLDNEAKSLIQPAKTAILNLIEAEVKAGMLRQRAYDERKIEAERREAARHELESIKRAVKNAEVNFEFDDARQTKTARTVVNVALELLRPQILEAINERIAHLTTEEDGEWTETWTKES